MARNPRPDPGNVAGALLDAAAYAPAHSTSNRAARYASEPAPDPGAYRETHTAACGADTCYCSIRDTEPAPNRNPCLCDSVAGGQECGGAARCGRNADLEPTRGHAPAPGMRRAVALLLLVALATCAVGCASTPPDRIAYNSIDAATTGVQAAVRAYGDLLAAGQVPASSRDRVKQAYESFQQAALLAVTVSRYALPSAEQKAANQAALAAVNAAASEVYAAARGGGK